MVHNNIIILIYSVYLYDIIKNPNWQVVDDTLDTSSTLSEPSIKYAELY